jgi:hypothetical protein
MGDTLESFHNDFNRITSEHEDFLDALVAVLRASYDLTEHEILRNRLLVAEQGLIGIRRVSPREEEARSLARARTRDLEFAWGTFLARGMQQGVLPEADPRLLTRAVLGLYNSIWHWFRPRGSASLADVADFYLRRQLALLGLSEELLDEGALRRAPRRDGRARATTKRAR